MTDGSVTKHLERIRSWLERHASHLASALQPGLSRQQMLQIMGPKAQVYRIPEEVVELYAWRNGQAGQAVLFGYLHFAPFEEAVGYGNLVGEYFEGSFPLMVFQELGYDAGYQVRCTGSDQELAPTYRWEHGDESVETSSLAHLLSAVAEAFEHNLFRPNEKGEFDVDEDAWNSILIQHHPDRSRATNALLQRQWGSLSAQEIRTAFCDLTRRNDPETAALVREYLSSHPDLPEQDFDTFHLVLSTGFAIQDEWSRDFGLSLIPTDVPRTQQTALTDLAWSWRGPLSLTAHHVDELINQILNSPRSESSNRERAMLLGISGDHRAIPTLLSLLNEDPVNYASRDTRIAALNALAELDAKDARETCLRIAQTDPDPGTRFTAICAMSALGVEDAFVEAAAKQYFREMLQQFGWVPLENLSPTMQRWVDEVKGSASD